MKKRISAILLSLALFCSLLPMQALAADWTENVPDISLTASALADDGTFSVTLKVGTSKNNIVAYNFAVQYDSTKVAPDESKGSTQYDEDLDDYVTTAVKHPSAEGNFVYNKFAVDSNQYLYSSYAGNAPGLGKDGFEVIYYFKTVSGASGAANFSVASGDATVGGNTIGLFSLSDQKDNVLSAPVSPLTATVSIPVSILTVSGDLTTPVKGATDASASAIKGDENCMATVTWNPELTGGKFAANTTYKATVTVTPNTGVTLTDDVTVNYTGTSDLHFTKSGDNFVATKTFPKTDAKTLTGITAAPKSAAAGLVYEHGDTVNPADITVTATYDDSSTEDVTSSATFTYQNGATLRKGDSSFTVNYGSATPATLAVTVNAKTVGLTWSTTTLIYNGNPQAPTATVTGLVGDEACAVTTYSGQETNAGTGYTVTATALDNANYKLPSEASTTFAIAKANWTGTTAAAGSAKYGTSGTVDLTALIAAGGTTGTVSVTGDSIFTAAGAPTVTANPTGGKVLSFTLANDSAKVGKTATVTIPVTGATNYEDYSITATITVLDKPTQAGFKFASDSKTATYGDDAFTDMTASGQEAGSTVSYVTNPADSAVATVNETSGAVTITGAGSVKIVATASATDEYAATTATYQLTVNPKGVTISGLGAADKYYDGTKTATVTGNPAIEGKVGSDDVTAVAGVAEFASKNASETPQTVTFSGYTLGGNAAGNYTLTAQPADTTAKINPFVVNPLVNTVNEKEYDGTTTVTGGSLIFEPASTMTGDMPDAITGTAASYAWISADAGTNKVNVTGIVLDSAFATNYRLSAAELTNATPLNGKTIVAKSVTEDAFTIDTADQQYTGSQITPSVASASLAATTDYTVAYGTNKDLGTGSITVSPVDGSNYTFTAFTKTFNIIPKTLTSVTADDIADQVYSNGAAIEPAVTVNSGDTSITLVKDTDYTLTYADNINAGTGKVTISPKSGSNYTFTAFDKTFTIAKATWTATTAAGSARYGTSGTVNLSALIAAGGTVGTVTWSTTNGIFDTATPPTVSGNTLSFKLVNDQLKKDLTDTVTIPVTGATNYEDYSITATITVLDKLVQENFKFAATAKTMTYGDGNNTFKMPATGNVAGTTVSYSSDDMSVATVDASGKVTVLKVTTGTPVTITATASETETYAPAIARYQLTVNQKEVGLSWSNTSLTYNGTAQAPTATATGLVPGDTCTVTVTGQQTNAGTGYTATASALDNANYKLPAAATKTFNISPKTVSNPTITLTPATFVYDGAAKEPAVEVKDGDTVINAGEYTAAYSNNTNAGTAKVTITDNDGGNYKVSGSTTFTIDPKTVTAPTITLTPATFVYDGAAKKPTVTVKDGDTEIATGEYSVSYADNVKAGTAKVTITDRAGGNYAVSGSTTFTIGKATVTIATPPTASDITFGQTLRKSILSGGAANTGTGTANVPGTFAWTDDTAVPTVADSNSTTYEVTFTPKDQVNYITATATITLTVEKAAQPVPTGLGVVAPADETSAGQITGTAATMEWALSEDGSWTACTATSTTDPAFTGDTTIYVRNAAGDGNHDASKAVAVQIPAAGVTPGNVKKADTAEASASQVVANQQTAAPASPVRLTVTPSAGRVPKTVTVKTDGTQKQLRVVQDETGSYVVETTMPNAGDLEIVSVESDEITVALSKTALNVTVGSTGQVSVVTTPAQTADVISTAWTVTAPNGEISLAADTDVSATINGLTAGTATLTATVTIGTKTYDPIDCTVTVSAAPAPTPGGGGGGGAPAPAENPVNITPASSGSTASHAKVTSSASNAKAGDKVTLTVTPDEGYQVDGVKVTDANGKEVPVTKNADGTYTFTMPATAVKVEPVVSETTTPPPATGSRFVDVPANAYYADAVDWAVDKGITTGTSETIFSPNDPCTRGQMVTFLWRLAGQPAPTGSSNPFTDVKEGAYYYDAVLWAVEKGITLGTSATTFSPNDTVNRAQTATFLYRYLQSTGGGFTGAWAFPLNYTDAADVPEYAYEAFCYWTMQGVIQGTDNNMLRPLDDCLRGQIVTMMYRAFQ